MMVRAIMIYELLQINYNNPLETKTRENVCYVIATKLRSSHLDCFNFVVG